MFKKGENPFAKGGKDKDDEDREESRGKGKRKKMMRKGKRMAKGR
jgi:hypothetical protein